MIWPDMITLETLNLLIFKSDDKVTCAFLAIPERESFLTTVYVVLALDAILVDEVGNLMICPGMITLETLNLLIFKSDDKVTCAFLAIPERESFLTTVYVVLALDAILVDEVGNLMICPGMITLETLNLLIFKSPARLTFVFRAIPLSESFLATV